MIWSDVGIYARYMTDAAIDRYGADAGTETDIRIVGNLAGTAAVVGIIYSLVTVGEWSVRIKGKENG